MIAMRETRILEFKETITNTFLKTVSALSNYNGGMILFGVDDDGNVKGLPDVKQACLDIENKINDSISPQPNYMLELQNNDQTIKLTVKSGLQKPYLYKSKAYKRNDTATIEVDTLEFSRLVLEGKNISFEELQCKDQELSFDFLQHKLKENIQIESFNQDTLKTLNLYDNANGFNNAAGLLADKNHFSGIDIVKWQIRIAAGIELNFTQADIRIMGSAIECRINAQNCGKLEFLHIPGGPSVRFDTFLVEGMKVVPFYDSLLGKLIVYAKTREETLRKMRASLCELVIDGIKTNVEEQLCIVEDDRFSSGNYDLTFMGNR